MCSLFTGVDTDPGHRPEPTTRLIANRQAWQDVDKRAKIEDVAMLLTSAIQARKKVGLKMNIQQDRVPEVRFGTGE